jgi:hypothetical protein
MFMALVIISALMAAIHDGRAQKLGENGSGFTIKLSLVDFMVIQRALMKLPPETPEDQQHIQAALKSIRAQITAQTTEGSH